MALKDFSNLIQNQIYKSFLEKLDKNIVTASAKSLRSSQQVSSKTSFYITEDTIKQVFKTIAGIDNIDSADIQGILNDIRTGSATESFPGSKSEPLVGKFINVGGKKAVFFESIGFDTISTRLKEVFDNIPAIENAFIKAEEDFSAEQEKALKNSSEYKKLKSADKQKAIDAIQKEAKRRASLGYYFNKGHVVAVATNLAREFKKDLEKADNLAEKQRNILINVLDQYINKLLADDLATANLPDAINQELYARYIKDSSKYLVELQIGVENIEAGSASIPIVEELRKVFGGKSTEKELLSIITKSPTLGRSLLESEGSPSMLALIIEDIKDTIQFGKAKSKKYAVPKTLVSKNTIKIKKPKKNTEKINSAKTLKNKLKSASSKETKVKNTPISEIQVTNLTALQNLLNAGLVEQVKKNMGTGNRRDILNLQTGRFAESVEVTRLSESRQGMITAFYTYMKNPYATFSAGGRQEFPRSRDPKLLIAKSIREIAAQQVGNRLRSVLV